MLLINEAITIEDQYLRFRFVRSQGPGGQNVNKVNTKAQLNFHLRSCLAIPEAVKVRLAKLAGRRMTDEGVLILECDQFREQSRNRQACLDRLAELIRKALIIPKHRRPTRPTRSSKERRLIAKQRRSGIKSLRRRAADQD
jgi:ribosome-associated protein